MAVTDDVSEPSAKIVGGVVHPTNSYMFVWGYITLSGVPAPSGTVVEAVDGAGTLAGQCQVTWPGAYGAMAVYLDDPTTPRDEGAVIGEFLSIRVNGQEAGSKFQWTQFGDVVQADLAVGSAVKSGSATVGGTKTTASRVTTVKRGGRK